MVFWEIIKMRGVKETPHSVSLSYRRRLLFFGGLVDTYIKDAGTLILLAVVTGLQNGLQRFNHSAVSD